jgi:menaquinone-dependent protoporphyrinogen oxidase
MRALVAYASRYGATAEIATRIADRMCRAGLDVDCVTVTDRPLVNSYDAFVVGSAVYLGQWEKEAAAFVDSHRAVLAAHPTWLFSSGPLGDAPQTESGEDKLKGAVTAEKLAALIDAVHPRGHQVFYGALRPERLGIGPRLMRMTPAGRKLLEEGDFRDWAAIERWADEIAAALSPVAAAARPGDRVGLRR